MATQSITTDLQTINTADPGTLGDWSALGGGASGLAEETDYAIQGTTSISKQVKQETKGQVANFGSGITLGSRDHIYTWLYATTPGATDLRANGGLRVTMGTSLTARKEFYVNGRDFYTYGGWVCYPVQYSQTEDATVGSPGASPQYFGGVMSNYVTVKGVNFGVDVIRYGTGIDATGGGTPDPDLTFAAIAAVNDSNANAWGVCQGTPSGASLQGELRVGADDGSTFTTFTDVDAVITNPNKNPSDVNQKTATNFTGIKLAGTNTTFTVTGCTFLSLDSTDPGYIDCDTATNSVGSATFDACTFLDWGGIGGSGNTLFDGCSFKNCAQMILNGSSVSDGTYINCAPVDVGTNLGLVSNSSFESGGSGHAITTSANSGSLSFVGNTFTGYSGTGANAALNFTATSGSITINISGGGDVPTYQTAGVAVNIVSASTLTFNNVVNGSEIRIYDAGTTTELDGIESVVGNTFSSSISVGSVDAVVFSLGHLEVRYSGLVTTSDQSVPVQQTIDRQYDNPA